MGGIKMSEINFLEREMRKHLGKTVEIDDDRVSIILVKDFSKVDTRTIEDEYEDRGEETYKEVKTVFQDELCIIRQNTITIYNFYNHKPTEKRIIIYFTIYVITKIDYNIRNVNVINGDRRETQGIKLINSNLFNEKYLRRFEKISYLEKKGWDYTAHCENGNIIDIPNLLVIPPVKTSGKIWNYACCVVLDEWENEKVAIGTDSEYQFKEINFLTEWRGFEVLVVWYDGIVFEYTPNYPLDKNQEFEDKKLEAINGKIWELLNEVRINHPDSSYSKHLLKCVVEDFA